MGTQRKIAKIIGPISQGYPKDIRSYPNGWREREREGLEKWVRG
jgi:hypothetical protein